MVQASLSARVVPPPHGVPLEAIVLGTSAGGIETLEILLGLLPATLRVPLIIVMHLPPERPSLVPKLLGQRCGLPVREPDDKEPVRHGVFIAPPGYHLLIEEDSSFSLSVDEPIRFSRPSIDLLFETAAEVYGAGLLCCVLTGANEDGAVGAERVHALGGCVVVQDPDEALWPQMPLAAIARAHPYAVLPVALLKDFICSAALSGDS